MGHVGHASAKPERLGARISWGCFLPGGFWAFWLAVLKEMTLRLGASELSPGSLRPGFWPTSSPRVEFVDHLSRMWPSDALSPAPLPPVFLIGVQIVLPGLSHRPAPGEEGQDLVTGRSAITRWNEAGVDPPKGRDCYEQNKEGNQKLSTLDSTHRPSSWPPANKFLFPCFPSPLLPAFPPSFKH